MMLLVLSIASASVLDAELVVLPAHDTRAVAWSPDGSQVASLHHEGSVLVWDLDGDSPVAALDGLGKPRELVWLPNGLIAIQVDHDTWRFWMPGEPAPRFARAARSGGVAGLPDGRIVTRAGSGVEMLSATGELLERWESGVGIHQIAAIDGRAWAVGGGCLYEVGVSDCAAFGVIAIELLPGRDGGWLIDKAGPRRLWFADGEGSEPFRLPIGGVPSPEGRRLARIRRGGDIQVLSTVPSVVHDRPPRDVIVWAGPEDGLQPDAVVAILAVARVPGDRVAWVVPGVTTAPEWIEVGGSDTSAALARQASRPVPDGSGDSWRLVEAMLATPGRETVLAGRRGGFDGLERPTRR